MENCLKASGGVFGKQDLTPGTSSNPCLKILPEIMSANDEVICKKQIDHRTETLTVELWQWMVRLGGGDFLQRFDLFSKVIKGRECFKNVQI